MPTQPSITKQSTTVRKFIRILFHCWYTELCPLTNTIANLQRTSRCQAWLPYKIKFLADISATPFLVATSNFFPCSCSFVTIMRLINDRILDYRHCLTFTNAAHDLTFKILCELLTFITLPIFLQQGVLKTNTHSTGARCRTRCEMSN